MPWERFCRPRVRPPARSKPTRLERRHGKSPYRRNLPWFPAEAQFRIRMFCGVLIPVLDHHSLQVCAVNLRFGVLSLHLQDIGDGDFVMTIWFFPHENVAGHGKDRQDQDPCCCDDCRGSVLSWQVRWTLRSRRQEQCRSGVAGIRSGGGTGDGRRWCYSCQWRQGVAHPSRPPQICGRTAKTATACPQASHRSGFGPSAPAS